MDRDVARLFLDCIVIDLGHLPDLIFERHLSEKRVNALIRSGHLRLCESCKREAHEEEEIELHTYSLIWYTEVSCCLWMWMYGKRPDTTRKRQSAGEHLRHPSEIAM